MKLRIDMEDFSGTVQDAYYDIFRLEDEVHYSFFYFFGRKYLDLLGDIFRWT